MAKVTGWSAIRAVVPHAIWARLRESYYRFRFSDRALVNRQFKQAFGRRPDLKNPQTFNEKIQWLKLYWRDDLAIVCADKAAARNYVAERIGPDVLNRVYGVFDSVDSIVWDELPRRFVMKATHGSGWNLICEDRLAMNWPTVRATLETWMRSNHYWKTREWVYKDIQPRIMVEELLNPGGDVPYDYKVFCFHGEPRYIEVDMGRFREHRRNFYDTRWQLLPVSLKHPWDPAAAPPKPPLEELLSHSARLAQPFPHVRVDWFVWKGGLRFGEMTFFHGMGRERFSPPEWDRTFGKHLDLSRVDVDGARGHRRRRWSSRAGTVAR